MIKKSICVLSLATSFVFCASTEDFFYQRGYENGFNKGFDEGVKKAFEEAKEVIRKYGNELRAYEVGKYLISSQKLTYPQVWQEISNDGSFKLRITPSKIEKELDVDGLFAKFSTLPTRPPQVEDTLVLSTEQQNSTYLADRDSNANTLPQQVDTQVSSVLLEVDKNSKHLEILKRANVIFSDEGDTYNVLFFTEQEKRDFCKSFKICN